MKLQSLLLVLTCYLIVGGCRKSPDLDELSSKFVVATNADKEADFKTYKTYFISDTIRYLTNTSTDTVLVGPDADQLINTVKSNMSALGYTFVGRFDDPDVGLNMMVVKDLNIQTIVYPDWWWDWWYPWYWYDWYYPPYYPWSYTYAYTTGSIYISMGDLKNAPETKKLRMLWDALMGGALGTQSQNIAEGVDAINQAFQQSSYLKTN
ncbi:DUF4136 domain-containing protein [Flavihumibacter petaseus]|uniref:DUF4136 domain-containing protein n=1 Tax=Flavihumibacter petaseus NBRC 106054 TaxID=1220578 RepID=A0A0E9MTL9_9BACT|nr:DUF4136 domain-containing protein [Flavihumibacter petaseus]GAO41112.1 hypothetical protein FPE01S_01_01240 [Flavihumibacter petaseus NBRC 106054]